MNNKRWYDFDPTVALAINLLEKSDNEIKSKISCQIIKRAKDFGIQYEEDVNTSFNFVWQRRSDTSSDFQNALQYMKKMDDITRKEIALEILNSLKLYDGK